MSAGTRLREAGFSVRLVLPDSIGITPVEHLTNTQRQWLIKNKPQIRRQLLDERWQWFLSLALNHGIHPDVVGTESSVEYDWSDVVESLKQDDVTLSSWQGAAASTPLRRCPIPVAKECSELHKMNDIFHAKMIEPTCAIPMVQNEYPITAACECVEKPMTWHKYPFDTEPSPCGSVDEFIHSLVMMPEPTGPSTNFIFRGHSSQSFKLLPTALRTQDGKDKGTFGPLGVRAIKHEMEQRREELILVKLFCKMTEAAGMPLPGIGKTGLRDALLSDRIWEHPGTFDETDFGFDEYQWPPEELLPVLALMQHYGMPTRLLDWSISPLTAGYFALAGAKTGIEEQINRADEVQIWALSVWEIEKRHEMDLALISDSGAQQQLSKKFPFRIIRTPASQNLNLRNQQGVFTVKIANPKDYCEPVDKGPVPTSRTEFHDDILNDSSFAMGSLSVNHTTPKFDYLPKFYRLSLPINFAMEAFQQLHSIGYSGSRLFEGYYGVVKSASEYIKIQERLPG